MKKIDDIEKACAEMTIVDRASRLVSNIEKVIIGKNREVIWAISALLADRHMLIEDVPGIGKTMLAKAIAKSVNAQFKRIQFTADLLPSDITGVNIYHQQSGEFRFRPGPLFTNVLLGDEINRATPRTQSSLLEAMEENQVSIDGTFYPVPKPFFVIATQNPIELEGTYPLPFAQLDRFIIRLRLGYLGPLEERTMIQEQIGASPIDTLEPVLDCQELLELQHAVRQVRITEELIDYAVAIVQKTRSTPGIEHGASPRAGLDLVRFSQATALINRRDYVLPDDIKASAPLVLAHRLIVRKGTPQTHLDMRHVIESILAEIEVPV
ncbi:MAG: AAA family ATPase [bacterium]